MLKIVRSCYGTSTRDIRVNPLGIQMIPEYMFRHLFGKSSEKGRHCVKAARTSVEHLSHHGLKITNKSDFNPTLDTVLPPLHGSDIAEHFIAIAEKQLSDYTRLIANLISTEVPRMPSEWIYQPGWTKYTTDKGTIKVDRVPYPDEDVMVFDVEVCVRYGHLPVMAAIVSPSSWYSWVSERLFQEQDMAVVRATPNDLISLGPSESKCRLVIGHHVSYDRARIKEEYCGFLNKMRFLDTLSLHVCISGQTTYQKGLWMKKHGIKEEGDPAITVKSPRQPGRKTLWMSESCPNGLDNVYKLYYDETVDKTPRDVFIKGSMADVRDKFQHLMTYCGRDVLLTRALLNRLYPLFRERCSHPVTLAGLLEMGSVYLPVNSSWNSYINSANYAAEDLENELNAKLMDIAEDYSDFKNKNDTWLSNLDWSFKDLRRKGKSPKNMSILLNKLSDKSADNEETFYISSLIPRKETVHLPGYPEWYRLLCDKRNIYPWRPGPASISSQMRIAPYILKMKWNGHPVYYHKMKGWGYLVSMATSLGEVLGWSDEAEDMSEWIMHQLLHEDNVDANANETIVLVNEMQYYFNKIPHKNGPFANCGNPLSKEYLPRTEDGTLTSQAGQDGQRILTINSMISSWRGAKSRIEDQFVVWFHDSRGGGGGAIIPQIMVAGTATRRAIERTWLTASNAKEFRVGSELKAMVQAPEGYSIVGADVDSQELWIASILGDSHFTGIHGGTALGWMTLQGNKLDGTDMHSKTAFTVGITRDQAKIFNYGRLYGAGRRFAELLLKQFNPSLTETELKDKANSLYNVTKGVRRVVLSKKAQEKARCAGLEVWSDGSVDQDVLNKHFKRVELRGQVKGRYWHGGTESHTFNVLEKVANSREPCTPVLKCRMTKALEPKHVGTDFMTSRVNWVVQSSAVDYLHLLLVSMRWLMDTYKINGRLCISIHDEVRYLVRSEDKYRAALALQLSNLFTRAMFTQRIGINDLPLGVAFFSAVDIDHVLRKEVDLDCKTPSNPHGLRKGYNIPYGESLDIGKLLEKIKTLNK